MIRKGKRAKVTYCKKAVCSAPVSADTRQPVKGQTRDAMETVRTVTAVDIAEAKIVEAKLHDGNPRTQINQVLKKEPRFQKKMLQPVAKDITLERLFQNDH